MKTVPNFRRACRKIQLKKGLHFDKAKKVILKLSIILKLISG